MKTFSEWLDNRDPELLRQIFTEVQYNEFFKDMSGRAKRIIGGIGAALTLGSASPKRMDVDVAQRPAIVRSVTNPVIQAIIDHIRKETGEIINPNDIKMIKPSEVISPEYGKDYEKVRDMSAKFQDSPQKIGDVDIPDLEIPRDLSAADMKIGELDKPIPVVFMDPNKFPRLEPGTRGFCTTVLGGQKFCVVDSPSNLSTLRHELSHSTQDMLFQNSLSDENPSIKYLTNNAEIGFGAEAERGGGKEILEPEGTVFGPEGTVFGPEETERNTPEPEVGCIAITFQHPGKLLDLTSLPTSNLQTSATSGLSTFKLSVP